MGGCSAGLMLPLILLVSLGGWWAWRDGSPRRPRRASAHGGSPPRQHLCGLSGALCEFCEFCEFVWHSFPKVATAIPLYIFNDLLQIPPIPLNTHLPHGGYERSAGGIILNYLISLTGMRLTFPRRVRNKLAELAELAHRLES